MSRFAFLLTLVVFVLSGCGGEEEASVPQISGSYNLVAQQQDSDCLPEVATEQQIFGFMTEAATGVRVMTMELSQEGGELSAELGPSGCLWAGVVDTTSSVTLSGDCHDGDIARSGRITAVAEPYGAGHELLGTLRVEVDTLDADGNPGPDGVPDCEVIADLEGTGS